MGIFTEISIADISKNPSIVSLANNPNFIQLESQVGSDNNIGIYLILKVNSSPETDELDATKIVITEIKTKEIHEFAGTKDFNKINANTFFVDEDRFITAENIRACFMRNGFLGGNFDILTSVRDINGNYQNGEEVRLISRTEGETVTFNIETDESFLRIISGDPTMSINRDTIDGGSFEAEIEVEIYGKTGIFLGVQDNFTRLGDHVITLSKFYNGEPIWFDLNSVMKNKVKFSPDFMLTDNWTDSGTIQDYRIRILRKNRGSRTPFYISEPLFVINGYDRNLESNDLSEYVYNTQRKNIVKPLTKQPALFHVKGQTQYFNFLLADPDRNINLAGEYNLGIIYKLYTQSRKFIADVKAHEKNRRLFNVANTVKLDIDGAIDGYNNVGFVEVYLSRAGVEVSEPLLFRILPECLYKVNDFAFLNSLGGWSSFNFSGTEATDFKASTNTIYKTQTPSHTISSDIESVYTKETEEQFTAQTMPVNKTVCDWLKELSSSIAVYELSTSRYIIIDDLNIKPNTKDDLFRLEIKYHYSDRYNALIV